MSTNEAKTTEPREEHPRGSSAKDDNTVLKAVQRVLAELAAVRTDMSKAQADMAKLLAEHVELRSEVGDLVAVVQAALPASLVQISAASLDRLIADAPQTRLRLLAPFSTTFGNFPQGEEFIAGDPRIRTHGKRMVLGLAPDRSDAPAKAVAKIIEKQIERTAQTAREQERQRLSSAAAASRAHAADLEAAAKAS